MNIRYLKRKNITIGQQGFTLIEALVAVVIFSIALVSLITMTSKGIAGTTAASNQVVAQFLAQEGLEAVRAQRDSNVINPSITNWLDGIGNCSPSSNSMCDIDYQADFKLAQCTQNIIGQCDLFLSNNNLYSTDSSGSNTPFSRAIWIEPVSGTTNQARVYSQVVWTQGNLTRQIVLSSTLTDWTTPVVQTGP